MNGERAIPHNPRVEGDEVETYWDCPDCNATLATWTQCPNGDCEWHDTAAWNQALTELDSGAMTRRRVTA